MPWVECKSGAVSTWGPQKGRKKGHNTKQEVERCEFCTPGGPPPAPQPPSPPANEYASPPSKPAPTIGHGPQRVTYVEGTAEVQPTRAAQREAEKNKDYPIDGPHTLMLWNEVIFWWALMISDALDKFVWKVSFHVDHSKVAVSPFAASQLMQGNVNNMYSRLAARICYAFKLPNQKSAHLAIEDAAFLSKFGGVLFAFGSHYIRIAKESPRLASWRTKRAEAKAKKEAEAAAKAAADATQEVTDAHPAATA